MAEATQQIDNKPISIPMEHEGDVVRLRPQNRIQRDIPRYVVLAGDLLPDLTKRNWREFQGVQLGGAWYDLTQVPALWRFNGFITRGRLTPLIKRPIQALADESIARKKKEEIAEVIGTGGQVTEEMQRAFRYAYPWDSLQTLLSPHIQRKGLVHVGVLDGVAWETGEVQEVQKFFFPSWEALTRGEASLSILIEDFIKHIESRRSQTDDLSLHSVADAYLESAEVFTQYAKAIADQSKRAYVRGVNELGYMSPITPLARHLAKQVGVTIDETPAEIAKAVRDNSQPKDDGRTDVLIEALSEQNTLLMKLLEGKLENTAPAPKKRKPAKAKKAESAEKE